MNNNPNLKKILDLFKKGEFNRALTLCNNSNDKSKEYIISNLKGAIYLKQKNYDLAVKNFFKSIELNKNFIDPYNNLYVLFNSIKDIKNLSIIAQKIYELDKLNPISNFKLAYSLELNGNLSQSIKLYKSAITLGYKDRKIIYNNLGNIYLQLDKIDKSIELFSLSYKENSNDKFIINNLIRAFIKKKEIEKIKLLLEKASLIDKNYSEYLYNKAEFNFLKEEFNEAIIILKELIKNYKNSRYQLLLAKIYFTIGETKKGDEVVNQCMNLFTNDIKVINFKGMRNLFYGHFNEGFKFYEHRRSSLNKLYTDIPEWNGENLIDKNILVYNEQGIGDCIQFSKYLFLLKESCKNIDFLVDKKIQNLFRKDINEIRICTKENLNLNKYNFKVPLGSIIKFFYKKINTIKENLIFIDNNKVKKFKKEMDRSKINIGLIWSGSFYGPNEPYRSIPLSKMNKILNLNANFFCLQNDIRESDQDMFKKSNIFDYGNLAFYEIPSFVKNLDLVISTDTSFLHMAGSIKKETWCLISINPDWRWGEYFKLDPYLNSKIYKQTKFNDWSKVLENVEKDLTKKINNFPISKK
jgi:tetratricopeptide (TPR) repeat protein